MHLAAGTAKLQLGQHEPIRLTPMKSPRQILIRGMLAVAVMAAASSTRAQLQTTGTPGSPDATVTIDGKQIPPPPMPFGGVIKDSATDSKPWWPPTVVPPKGAPNILLIMTDDQRDGFRVLLRVHGRRDQSVDALSLPRSYRDLPVDREARLQPDHRHGR